MKKRKRIYIAGPISGDENYREKFMDAENRIKKYFGDTVDIVNPIRHTGETYKELIDKGLKELMTCDAIYALNGYKDSNGALVEVLYARATCMEVKLEEFGDWEKPRISISF